MFAHSVESYSLHAVPIIASAAAVAVTPHSGSDDAPNPAAAAAAVNTAKKALRVTPLSKSGHKTKQGCCFVV